MGVVRYKSTGDMLEAASKKVESELEEEEEEEDDAARKRPLLKEQQHQMNSDNRWSSCKFLGHNNDNNNSANSNNKRRNSICKIAKGKLYDEDDCAIELKKWLAIEQDEQLYASERLRENFNISRGEQKDQLSKKSGKFEAFGEKFKDLKKEKVAERLSFETGQQMKPVDWCESQVYDSVELADRNIISGIRSHHHHHQNAQTTSSSKSSQLASGALRRRRAARMKLASLSLSSPALAAANLRDNPSSNQSSVSGKTHLLRRLRNNDRQIAASSNCKQRQLEDNNATTITAAAAAADDDSVVLAIHTTSGDVHASAETKVANNSSADRLRDCFVVDVDQLQQQQQQQICLSTSAETAANRNTNCLYYIDGQRDAVKQAGLQAHSANDNRLTESERQREFNLSSVSQTFGGQFCGGQAGGKTLLPSTCSLISANNNLPSEQEQHARQRSQQLEPTSGSQPTRWPAATRQQQQQQQQQALSDPNAARRAQSGSDPLRVNNKLMVDLNSTAGSLIGSCCNSWRQAIQLHPNSSGSYKVARHQQQVELISGHENNHENSGNTLRRTTAEQETEARVENNRAEPLAQQVNNAQRLVAKERRFAPRSLRPSRSPISLQRQTNARLTWHRIKIQQQRQEQLVQLALRERQQLNLQNHYNQRQQQSRNSSRTINSENQIERSHRGDQTTRTDYESFYLIHGNRYSLPSRTTGHSSAQSNYYNQTPVLQQERHGEILSHCDVRERRLSLNNRNFDNRKQHQVIIPTAISSAIEICDNQPACSSRQHEQRCQRGSSGAQQQQLTTPAAQTNKKSRTSGNSGNVIVYKSINMLTSGTSSSSRQQYHNIGNTRQSNNECDGRDSDDAVTISSAASTLSLDKPFCKICHVGATKNGDKLISPCKCSGTMQYIHCGCLLKWLEISNRTNEKPMNCELCAHEYTWHKKFNYKHMKLPKCSIKDLLLHMIFIAAVGAMLLSAMAPMLYRKSNQDTTGASNVAMSSNNHYISSTTSADEQPPTQYRRQSASVPNIHQSATFSGTTNHLATGRLAHDEKFMLACAASFFVSFFLAIYVQTRARDTLYGLVVKFLSMNQTYYITEYDHGQLSGISNNINNGNGCNSKQQQQQQPFDIGERVAQLSRKNSD